MLLYLHCLEEVFHLKYLHLFEEINIVPAEEFKEFVPKAEKMLSGHIKDVPYLALALKLECPIFSGDKVLKRLSPVRVFSPRELLDSLLGLTDQSINIVLGRN
jgi:predicted nucleic acid-binding protein